MESPIRRKYSSSKSSPSHNQANQNQKSSLPGTPVRSSPRKSSAGSNAMSYHQFRGGGGGDSHDANAAADSVFSDFQNLFLAINEKRVEEITLEVFYKPHTITLLIVSITAIFWVAFTRDCEAKTLEENIWHGFLSASVFFLIIGLLTFPNGPFTRPHPLIWRCIFGLSVLYLGCLVFLLFQRYETIRKVQLWFFPELTNYRIDAQEDLYAQNCSDITMERIWGHVDVFAAGHYIGWLGKAVLIRHYGICWTISVTWEITELAFMHLLPNFAECWWDSIVLDVLVCNGLGIWTGMKLCKVLEMRDYKWESLKEIQTTTGKLRRAVLQFTPASWTNVRWLDPHSTPMRFLAVTQFVIFWQITELNTFFLKHIFDVPPGHTLNVGRLVVISLITAPSIRQFYVYVTDTRIKRMGTHCWVYCAIMLSEAMICIKFGVEIFARTQLANILLWILIQFGMSAGCVYLCVLWARTETSEKFELIQPLERANLFLAKLFRNRNFTGLMRQDSLQGGNGSGSGSRHKRTRSCGSERDHMTPSHSFKNSVDTGNGSSASSSRRESYQSAASTPLNHHHNQNNASGSTLVHRSTNT